MTCNSFSAWRIVYLIHVRLLNCQKSETKYHLSPKTEKSPNIFIQASNGYYLYKYLFDKGQAHRNRWPEQYTPGWSIVVPFFVIACAALIMCCWQPPLSARGLCALCWGNNMREFGRGGGWGRGLLYPLTWTSVENRGGAALTVPPGAEGDSKKSHKSQLCKSVVAWIIGHVLLGKSGLVFHSSPVTLSPAPGESATGHVWNIVFTCRDPFIPWITQPSRDVRLMMHGSVTDHLLGH